MKHCATANGIENSESPKLLLVGNPNVGKSVFFNLLTGRYVAVSNYPGTTVEMSRGRGRFGGRETEVVDTPGANSLNPNSEDERVARDVVLAPGEKTLIQVADAKNLQRALLLTAQLAELAIPMVLVLNMWDEAQDRGVAIDLDRARSLLGIEVIPTVATERRGLGRVIAASADAQPAKFTPLYGDAIEAAVKELAAILPDGPVGKRGLALMLLAGAPDLANRIELTAPGFTSQSDEIRLRCAQNLSRPISAEIQKCRVAASEEIIKAVLVQQERPLGTRAATTLAMLSSRPVTGLIILIIMLWATYEIVGVFGAGTCVDFVQNSIFGTLDKKAGSYNGLINGPLSRGLSGLVGSDNLVYRFFFGAKAGLISTGLTYAIAIVFPIVTLFFLVFSLMEDSGYLPRLSLLADRLFKRVGLSGKAVLPMVLGLGCGTMAVMTTRILETRRQRLIAMFLLALAVPCSAQLGIIAAVLAAISLAGVLIYFVVLFIAFFGAGWAASKLVPGDPADLFLEVPPFRWPQLGNVVIKTYHRVKWFMREAVPYFLLGTVCLFVADETGLLRLLEAALRPVVTGLLGLPAQAAEGFILGFLRRDYGTVIVFEQFRTGVIGAGQALIALIVITLFVPCLAHFFVCIKELGLKKALLLDLIIVVLAVLVGVAVRLMLAATQLQLTG